MGIKINGRIHRYKHSFGNIIICASEPIDNDDQIFSMM